MDAGQYIVAIGAIVGIINGLSLYEKEDKKGFIYFCVAVVLGVVFGFFHWYQVPSPEIGLLVALNSSAGYKGLQLLGGLKK